MEYFKGGNYSQYLELLRHLCQYGENIILVNGQPGSGKSTLIQALQHENSANFKFCVVTGTADLDLESFMQKMAAGFGLPWGQDIQSINKLPATAHSRWILLIDDADLLAIDILEAVLALAKPELQIVLFAKPELEKNLVKTKLQPVLSSASIIEIEPLNLADMESFIYHKWRLAGNNSSLPFDKSSLKKIHKLSKGVPKEVENIVKEVLSGKTLKKFGKLMSPIMLGFTAFFGILFVIVSLVIQYQEEPSLKQVKVVDTSQKIVDTSQKIVDTSQKVKVKKPEAIIAKTNPVIIPEITINKTTPSKETTPPKESTQEKIATLRNISQQQAEPPKINIKTTDSEHEELLAKIKQEYETKLQKEQNLRKNLEKKLQLALENNIKAETIIKSYQQQQKSQIKAKIKPKLAIEHTPKYTKDEKYLLRQPSKQYTLQLLGTSQKIGIEKYIKQNKLTGKAYYYKTRYKGRPWYILVYGSYKSRNLAQQAIAKLPQELRALTPWPREFARIQRSLNAR